MDPIDFWLFSAQGCHTKTELLSESESLQPWFVLSKKIHTFCWMFVCFVCFHTLFSYSFQICFCKEFLQTCYKYWCVGVHPCTNTPHALIYKCQACFPSVSDRSLTITAGCTFAVDVELLNGSHTKRTQFSNSRSQSILLLSLKPCRTVGLNSLHTASIYAFYLRNVELSELMLKTRWRSVS